jgi:hypothetical protein
MEAKLLDLAEVIRSKNSGPYELTLDIILKEREVYETLRDHQSFTRERVAQLYGIDPDDVLAIIPFDPVKAFKINLRRPLASGELGETDVYGAQQHAPLLTMRLSW